MEKIVNRRNTQNCAQTNLHNHQVMGSDKGVVYKTLRFVIGERVSNVRFRHVLTGYGMPIRLAANCWFAVVYYTIFSGQFLIYLILPFLRKLFYLTIIKTNICHD
jgi:hypothetical protein